MSRLILREVARWGRAAGAPLAVFAAVTLGPSVLAPGTVRLAPASALFIGWLAAGSAALAWLLMAAVRAALQPARDKRAAEHLQELRDGAAEAHAHLLCIERNLARSLGVAGSPDEPTRLQALFTSYDRMVRAEAPQALPIPARRARAGAR